MINFVVIKLGPDIKSKTCKYWQKYYRQINNKTCL